MAGPYLDPLQWLCIENLEVILHHFELENAFLRLVQARDDLFDGQHYLEIQLLLRSLIVLRTGRNLAPLLSFFLFLLQKGLFLLIEDIPVVFVVY